MPTQHEGRAAQFGMQKGRAELLPGVLQPDGSTTYETDVTPYVDKQGRQRFRGDCVQGPPDEPFLYLSYRFAGEGAWIGRGKALLAPLTEDFLAALPESAVLETRMMRLGGRDRTARWRVVEQEAQG